MDYRSGPPRYEDPRMIMMGQPNMSSVPGFSHVNYPIRDSAQGLIGMPTVSVPDNHITYTHKTHYNEMPVQQNSLNASKMLEQQNSLNASKMLEQQNSLNASKMLEQQNSLNASKMLEQQNSLSVSKLPVQKNSLDADTKTEEENIRQFMDAAYDIFLKIKKKELKVKQAADILGRPYSFVYTRYHEFCHPQRRTIIKDVKKESPKIKVEPKQKKIYYESDSEEEVPKKRKKRKVHYESDYKEKTESTGIRKKRGKYKKSVKQRKKEASKVKQKNFVCKQCGHRFNATRKLVEHMYVHAGAKPYTCDMCDARFNFKSGLYRHKMTHVGEEPYKCNLCPMKFFHEKGYIQHQLVHSNVKAYKCDLCDFSTKRKHNLQYHKNIHTGETPFKCNFDGCAAAYAKPGSLRRHKLQHEQPQKTCKECYEKFPDLMSLKRHYLIHTGGKLEECDQCGKTFVDKPALKRHMNMHLYKPPGTKTKQVRQPRKNPPAKKIVQPVTTQKIWNTEYQVPMIPENLNNGHNAYAISTAAANAEDTSSQHSQQTFNAFTAVSQQYSNLVNSNLAMVNNAWPSNMDHDELRRRFLCNFK